MKTKVNICTEEWCNLVFEGKNKNYGAFAIRTHSDEVKIKALFITLSLAVSIAIYPLLTRTAAKVLITPNGGEQTVLSHPSTEIPPEIIKPATPEPPLPRKATIAFNQIEITNNEVRGDIATIESLLASKKAIGFVDQEGDLTNDLSSLMKGGATGDGKKEEIFKAVEKMPQFPGGTAELIKFLKRNLNYPELARDNNISGKVYAQFVVDKTGEIKNLQIVRGLDASCNKETIRVINLMPRWTPGMQNGFPVSVYFTLPLMFSLEHQ